jgi:hypothetical protein
MASYSLNIKPVSRAAGRSATAAAAYRAGEKIHDLSSDQVFDYTRKRGVEHVEIVLPTAAAQQDINWARDRQALWNAAERAENRSNSRVAREYRVALPHELTGAQRVELVRAFATELANRYGVAVDFALHAPHRDGDQRNYHVHMLSTTRTIEAGGLGAKSELEWSDGNRRKAGLVPGDQEITRIRARWETLHNEYLQALGIEARIDHRSLEAQGIEREPQSHLGPAVSAMERRGMLTEVRQRLDVEAMLAAQERLEKAAELGKLEREKILVERSIMDLSGDLEGAKRERDRLQQKSLGPAPSLEQIRAQARENWRAYRAEQLAKEQGAEPTAKPSQEVEKTPTLSLDERQQQAAERWAEHRRQQLLEPGREHQPNREIEKSREKNLDHGIEDDFGL